MSDPITNFVNWYSLHLPGDPFVVLCVFVVVMTLAIIRLRAFFRSGR